MPNPNNPNPNGQPQAAQPQQGKQISPVQVLAAVEDEATTGWCVLTTMIMTRVQLDQEGASMEDRKALIEFWHDSYVKSNVKQWKEKINTAQNRMAAMQQGGTLDQLMTRLDKLPNELRQKFGTFIKNGAENPVSSIKEAVQEFRSLQKAAKQANQAKRGGQQ